MNRGFLEDLGLEKSVIDAVMREHGKTVNTSTSKIEELTEKITELNSTVSNLQNENGELKKIDVNGLNAQIETLKNQNEEMKTNHDKALNDIKFNSALELAIANSKTIDPVGLKAHIDKSKLSYNAESNSIDGMDEQMKAIQKEYSYLFNTASQGTNQGGMNNSNNESLNLGDALKERYKK